MANCIQNTQVPIYNTHYHFSQLLILYPWRKEEELIKGYESYEQHFNEVNILHRKMTYLLTYIGRI